MNDDEVDRMDRLLDVTGVARQKAEGLLDEYGNLYTVSWAATHDGEYVQREFRNDPDFLRRQMIPTSYGGRQNRAGNSGAPQ